MGAACGFLSPDVQDAGGAAANFEKHGPAYDACAKQVVEDAVIVSANVVIRGMNQHIPVEVVAAVLRAVVAKESAALAVCAEGKTPERLWTPPADAGSTSSTPTTHI